MSSSQQNTALTEQVFPYHMWWGLAGCAALMALIFGLAPYSDPSMFVPDKGDFWYYWQLKDPTVWSRSSAWGLYALHQIAIWFLIFKGRDARPKYIFGLHWFNVLAISVNAFFIVMHILQTKFFYDGLAQDVHEATSMMSVVLMLFMILIMENGRRGLFFGKKVKAMYQVGDVLKRYHGYYISWAIIYTFWYHPIEMTSSHLAGYAYMMLLLLQSSLFFTKFHVNRWWTMFLESLFVIHGALVSYFIFQGQQTGGWAMFLFGGVAIFLITQLHGLGLSKKGKLLVATPLIATMVVFYAFVPEYLFGVTQLPMTMYLGAFLMTIIIWLLMRFARLIRSSSFAEAA